MVSKVAVIALVAIIAVPIMLGYAMNLEEVTEIDYKTTGDPVNVTQLLQNGTAYTYAHGDTYQLNSDFTNQFGDWNGAPKRQPTTPQFEHVSTVKGSYTIQAITVTNWDRVDFTYFSPINIKMVYDEDVVNLTGTLLNQNNATLATYTNIKEMYYENTTNKLYVTYLNEVAGMKRLTQAVVDITPHCSMGFTRTPSTQNVIFEVNRYNINGSTNTFADISAGYHFISTSPNNTTYNTQIPQSWSVNLPENTKSTLLTLNLDSITDATYGFDVNVGGLRYSFQKTTIDGNVVWTLYYQRNSTLERVTDLYYDQSRSDNTYQLEVSLEPAEAGREVFTSKLNYVGGWPSLIGRANSFLTYEYEYNYTTQANGLDHITFSAVKLPGGYVAANTPLLRTPTIRVDDAYFRAFEYPVISNEEYRPADFKSNPVTTITNINQYGTSISFAGNTYTVDEDGNITLGTRKIPVNNLQFQSVYTPQGYDNKIGDTSISVTPAPSTITFNGNWGASISTTAQEEYEYTKTEWIAGGFGWDGVDQNFLMVGLITCLGVFIALGIYARRSGARVLPLMIVCGGAALLFFVML